MSERERWIVYPLLFFALGAAVRDKILHRVDAKEIYCESLRIVDQHDPTGRAYVELGIQRTKPNSQAQNVGFLRLVDQYGKDVCRVSREAFFQELNSKQLILRDEQSRPLVVAGGEPSPGGVLPNGEQAVISQGVIYLINEKLQGIKLAPSMKRKPGHNARGAAL